MSDGTRDWTPRRCEECGGTDDVRERYGIPDRALCAPCAESCYAYGREHTPEAFDDEAAY